MRILITGASGFIGRKLTSLLCEQGHNVAIITRTLAVSFLNVKLLSSNLSDSKSEIIDFQPEVLFHLAGSSIYSKNSDDQKQLINDNVLFGTELLDILSSTSLKKIINFNTSLAYKEDEIHPYSYYALTKTLFFDTLKFYCLNHNFVSFNLILYNVYGKEDKNKRALNFLLDSIDSELRVSMSPGEQKMDFIHVDDVLNLCLKTLDIDPNSMIEDVFVGTGIGYSLKEVADFISFRLKKNVNVNFGGIPYRSNEKMINVAPIEKNRFWSSSISFEEGLLSIL